MYFYKRSLRTRIFLSMLLLVVGASVLIAIVTVYQYRKEAEDYHRDRLLRKESAIRENINYVLKTTTYPVETKQIPLIFKEKIYEIKDIHSLEILLYDLNGNLLKSSRPSFFKDTVSPKMPDYALQSLQNSPTKSYIKEFEEDGQKYQSSYTYITDSYFKPLAILNLPYIEDDGFLTKELKEYLYRLAVAYFFMLLVAIALAYFLSKYITRSLKEISDKLSKTRFHTRNNKIHIHDTSEEIAILVNSYNGMIDELEKSAAQLAASERETAWREMAKQVAHEIKNPLTPMRLTVQSFQRRFDCNDPDIDQKMEEYTQTLLQQIDTLSSIASAFSTYAKMPAQQDETLNVVKFAKLALDIFNEDYIYFFSDEEEIRVRFDRTQLIRVVTNLVKNSIQSIEQKNSTDPRVDVIVKTVGTFVNIVVTDNGIGVPEENRDFIFEPQFTTKSSGMGLGLGMVKNIVETYGGTVTLESSEEKTTFTVSFPAML
ncbi:sensor histidine kinase [Aequorivita viscosa]|uniref:histidine kinase n=1 Tax=Aequorivita viscosa TaxID=797419 RepID=A0A1M6C7Z1_9FLAO|nr:ATP-binding protein [Aequorivita viscosa]SDW24648.1 HAMP domain-containing protein [Aequorivita viscosa]SHI56901.1 HAMP domain-containing protein [Aequorivita viscosa]